jgi:hypothetical protein
MGLQQREPHQIELRMAAADAFEFVGDRFKRVNPFRVADRRWDSP